MKTVLVGIARMNSSRLPGKVLADLGGKPVLAWIVAAAEAARYVDDFIIATTTDPKDDAIEEWCRKRLVKCHRGSEDDVLDRFTEAALNVGADIAVRVTCDCPFIDPNVIDQVIALRHVTGSDYCSNIDPPTWPDGLDCEAITMATLHKANEEATSKIDRECVTTWIQRNRHRFSAETLMCPLPGMHKERWVLDTADDYKFCQWLVRSLTSFDWLSIYRFLEAYPWVREINAHHPRNERYYAALATEPLPPRSYATSKALLDRAERVIPLGAQTYSKSKVQYPAESPLFLSHVDGGYCFDVDGNRYVDLVGGLLPVILGHRDPVVDSAVQRQINRGVCFSLATSLETELAETLCRLIPCAEMVRFGKNGTDVTSAAVRLARAHTGRDYIISSGYHGWADWAVVNDPVRNLGVAKQQAVIQLDHGDSTRLQAYLNMVAAVIVEPETDPEFLRECRKFCDETGALLIFDEIITGFRFGLGGAQELYGITPDLACFGKSMGNGYPISALVGRRDIMKTMEKISFSGTFFGDAVGLAAAIATIKKLERENVLPEIHHRQAELLLGLDWPQGKCGISISANNGPQRLPRLSFKDRFIKTLFIQEMAQQGVLIIASHNLSYAHGPNEIRRVLTAYEHTFDVLAEAIKTDTVLERIKGQAIHPAANVRATA